jgi:hypothetical protein
MSYFHSLLVLKKCCVTGCVSWRVGSDIEVRMLGTDCGSNAYGRQGRKMVGQENMDCNIALTKSPGHPITAVKYGVGVQELGLYPGRLPG